MQGASHSTYYVEFRLRQRLAKNLIEKAADLLKEAARLAGRERNVASLSEMVETLKVW